MALLRVTKTRGQFWPIPVVTPETAPFAVVQIVRSRTYALRMIESGDLVTRRDPRTKQAIVEKFMTKIEAQMYAAHTLGMVGLEFVDVVEINAAGGIVE